MPDYQAANHRGSCWPRERSTLITKGKEAMRKPFVSLLGVGLLGMAVGCFHHTAGVCDCEQVPPHGGLCPSYALPAKIAPAPYSGKPETIKEMPKDGKEAPPPPPDKE